MAQYALCLFVIHGNTLMAAANADANRAGALTRLETELTRAARIRLRTPAVWALVYESRSQMMLNSPDEAMKLADATNTLQYRIPIVWPGWLKDDLLHRPTNTHSDYEDREIIERVLGAF